MVETYLDALQHTYVILAIKLRKSENTFQLIFTFRTYTMQGKYCNREKIRF